MNGTDSLNENLYEYVLRLFGRTYPISIVAVFYQVTHTLSHLLCLLLFLPLIFPLFHSL